MSSPELTVLRFTLGLAPNALGGKFYLEVGGNVAIIAGPTIAGTSRWHHIAVVNNGGVWTGYVDGSAVGSASAGVPATNPSAQWYINGREYGGAFNGFNGTIDDVRVYNRALSAQEVLQLYNAGK